MCYVVKSPIKVSIKKLQHVDFLLEKEQKEGMNIFIFFIHTALSIVVELCTGIFNWFCSTGYIHQTVVSAIHHETIDMISFQNNKRNIVAWGTGIISSTKQRKKAFILYQEQVFRLE